MVAWRFSWIKYKIFSSLAVCGGKYFPKKTLMITNFLSPRFVWSVQILRGELYRFFGFTFNGKFEGWTNERTNVFDDDWGSFVKASKIHSLMRTSIRHSNAFMEAIVSWCWYRRVNGWQSQINPQYMHCNLNDVMIAWKIVCYCKHNNNCKPIT
jgi:hypothetical protein